jgi:hypothetical protein
MEWIKGWKGVGNLRVSSIFFLRPQIVPKNNLLLNYKKDYRRLDRIG